MSAQPSIDPIDPQTKSPFPGGLGLESIARRGDAVILGATWGRRRTAPSGPRATRIACAAIGAALVLLGGSVIAGWILQIRAMVQLLPGITPVSFNSALGFVLAGAWLVVATLRPDLRKTALALAAALSALAAAVLAQDALGVDLSIDAQGLQRWLPSMDPHPGRMSAFSAAGFVAAGTAMALAGGTAQARRDLLALALGTVPGVIGVLALLGYVFELHLVYAHYSLGLVALRSAIGFLAISIALWLRLVGEGRVYFWRKLEVQDRITFGSAAILTLASLAAAVIVFAALEARVTHTLSDGLASSLRYRVLLAEAIIEAGLQRTRIFVGRPAPARLLRRFGSRPDDADALAQLTQSARSLLPDGYVAGIYYDLRGTQIVAAGEPVREPELTIALRGAPGATLVWKNRFVISGHYPIVDSEGDTGFAVVQAPLPALDALLADSYRLGDTGEAGMCARAGDRLGCFPQPRIPKVYSVPIKGLDGTPLPMSRGLAGETGVVLTKDYRGANVMAAFAPVGEYGLAMVEKIDTAEIYAPVRERLQFIFPLLVLLIAAGTFILRTSVRPLAARLAQSEREAREQRQAVESMMANVADGMMMLDSDGTIRSWNPAAETLFGYSAAEVIGQNLSMLVPEELREANIAATRRFAATGESDVVERANLNYPALRKDRSRFELEFTVTGMGGGDTPHLVAIFRDITERKRAERRLIQLALHDKLTGLPNRANFEQRVEDAFAKRDGGSFALMVLDLDKFKTINDTLGHAAGDQLLAQFAGRLRAALRDSDLIARLGGDEFTILAENLKSSKDTAAIGSKVMAAMGEPFAIDGRDLTVTTSIGIAVYREGDTPQTLMKRADAALYEAKAAGRARYQIAE